jgi:hypothetical protein
VTAALHWSPGLSRAARRALTFARCSLTRDTWPVAIALVMVSALVGGCGGNGGYSNALVSELGNGSTELRQVLVEGAPPEAPQFSPRQRQRVISLFRGDLASVTPAQLDAMIRVQRGGLRASRNAEASLMTRRRKIANSVVVASRDSSSDVREFVRRYNRLVSIAADANRADLQGIKAAVLSNRRVMAALQRIKAYYATGISRGLPGALAAASASIVRVSAAIQQQTDPAALRAQLNAAATPLLRWTNKSDTTKRLVRDVRDRYPGSLFRDIFVSPR